MDKVVLCLNTESVKEEGSDGRATPGVDQDG